MFSAGSLFSQSPSHRAAAARDGAHTDSTRDSHLPSVCALTALLTVLEPLAVCLLAQQVQLINYLYTI